MSNKLPIGCAACAKPKTVHLTQIIGGEVNKLHLCDECPLAKEVGNEGAVNIVCESNPSLDLSGSGIKSIHQGLTCPECGFTQGAFKESGRLGCPSCYDVFAEVLEPVLSKAHRGLSHKGKCPANFEAPVSPEEIEALKASLQAHVAKEEYEKAAELRDKIWELESRVSQTSGSK